MNITDPANGDMNAYARFNLARRLLQHAAVTRRRETVRWAERFAAATGEDEADAVLFDYARRLRELAAMHTHDGIRPVIPAVDLAGRRITHITRTGNTEIRLVFTPSGRWVFELVRHGDAFDLENPRNRALLALNEPTVHWPTVLAGLEVVEEDVVSPVVPVDFRNEFDVLMTLTTAPITLTHLEPPYKQVNGVRVRLEGPRHAIDGELTWQEMRVLHERLGKLLAHKERTGVASKVPNDHRAWRQEIAAYSWWCLRVTAAGGGLYFVDVVRGAAARRAVGCPMAWDEAKALLHKALATPTIVNDWTAIDANLPQGTAVVVRAAVVTNQQIVVFKNVEWRAAGEYLPATHAERIDEFIGDTHVERVARLQANLDLLKPDAA